MIPTGTFGGELGPSIQSLYLKLAKADEALFQSSWLTLATGPRATPEAGMTRAFGPQ